MIQHRQLIVQEEARHDHYSVAVRQPCHLGDVVHGRRMPSPCGVDRQIEPPGEHNAAGAGMNDMQGITIYDGQVQSIRAELRFGQGQSGPLVDRMAEAQRGQVEGQEVGLADAVDLSLVQPAHGHGAASCLPAANRNMQQICAGVCQCRARLHRVWQRDRGCGGPS